ncbi:MAG TPA: SusF/SusE family outer membrane protein [Candidatus Barnesiella excrementigallinarum]|nr:SusF/SusE family outer membrane protein [Candidatus Barnesiella excrementigallinarum]
MKTHKFTAIVAIMLMGLFMASCDEEKDIIVIDGNIPIKTSTLYIVGDATPALWDVNNMYPLEMSEEDHLVFIYDGILSQGELKAYLTQGSWDQAPCVRPMTAGSPISKADNTEQFQLYTGGEDLKWSVKDSGHYRLVFDLRNWTLSTTFLGY